MESGKKQDQSRILLFSVLAVIAGFYMIAAVADEMKALLAPCMLGGVFLLFLLIAFRRFRRLKRLVPILFLLGGLGYGTYYFLFL